MINWLSEKTLEKILRPIINYAIQVISAVTESVFISLFGTNFRELMEAFAQKGIIAFFELLFSFVLTQLNLFFYNLLVIMLFILDIIAAGFGVISGRIPVSVRTAGGWEKKYLIDFLFDGEGISRAYWGITLIAFILLIGITIYSVLRSSSDLENKKPLGKVLGQSVRAMLIYLILPFIVAAGIKLSSVVLNASANAISGGGNVSVGTHIFVSVIQDAARDHVPTTAEVAAESVMNFIGKGPMALVEECIKSMYAAASILTSPSADYSSFSVLNKLSKQATAAKPLKKLVIDEYLTGDGGKFGEMLGFGSMPYLNPYYNYQLIRTERVHSFIGLLCGLFVLGCMFMATYIAVKKLFEIIVLYLISPYFVASIPLDDGDMFGKWRDMFIVRIGLGFGIVLSMEIFLLLVPVIFSRAIMLSALSLLDAIMRMTMLCAVAMSIVKSHMLVTKILESGGGAGSDFDHEGSASKMIEGVFKKDKNKQNSGGSQKSRETGSEGSQSGHSFTGAKQNLFGVGLQGRFSGGSLDIGRKGISGSLSLGTKSGPGITLEFGSGKRLDSIGGKGGSAAGEPADSSSGAVQGNKPGAKA